MVGVHTLGGDELNRGVVITPKVREIINGWIEEMKTIFDISGRNIGNKGIMDFKASFAEMTEKITELRLGNNLIGPEGIKKLMENKWSSLKVLSLENNNLKLEGA
jgi:Ran GTPase-activating protein (RanGAP) involved in mRNA processing and transport